jgi:hypothetical protein
VWTGYPNDWSPREADAWVFQFAGVAGAAAYLHNDGVFDAEIEPVYIEDARPQACRFIA